MKRSISVWEIIAWLGLILLVIWIILKLFRVIQTSLILEMTPVITLCLILGSLLADMKSIKSEIKMITSSLIKLGQDFRQLKGEHEIIKHKKH